MCDIFPIKNPSIVVFPFENQSRQQLTIPSTTNQPTTNQPTTNQSTPNQPPNWNEMMTQHMIPAHVSQEYLEEIGFYSDEGSMGSAIEEPLIEELPTKQNPIKQNPIKQPVAQKAQKRERGSGNQTFEQMEPRDPKEVRDELGEKLGVSLVTLRRYEENIRPDLLNGENEPVLRIEKERGNSQAKGVLELFENGSKAFVFTEVLPGTTYGGLLVIVAKAKDGVIPTLNAIATAYNQLAGLRGAKSAPQHFFGNDYQNNPNFIQFKALLGCKERKSSNTKGASTKKKAKLVKE